MRLKGSSAELEPRRLVRLLAQGPRSHGFANELWTLERVAVVIRREFGVSHHPSAVWHILRALGWSCQKPQRLARERDEEAIRRWRRRRWPQIKKEPPPRADRSCSSTRRG